MNTRKKLLAEYRKNPRSGEQKTLPLFVYGTLLSGFWNHRLIARDGGVLLGAATVKGFELHGFPIPTAVFSSLPEAEVVGELYAFPAETYQKTLQSADRLESEGGWYSRLLVEVCIAGELVEAWMYVVVVEEGRKISPEPYFDYRARDAADKYISSRVFDEDGLTEDDYR